MTTTPVTASAGNQATTRKRELKSEDFIKMMITQLQSQDPLNPAKGEDLMAQMSQIGQLQSSTQLQDTLKGLALQNQISGAGNLIGKMVQGIDARNDMVRGLVTAVRVEGNKAFLELDNGKTLAVDQVTAIAPGPTNAATAF